MSKVVLSLPGLILFASLTCAQSGRTRGITKTTPPVPPVPVASPSPNDLLKLSKPSLPKIVDGERIYTSKEVDERVHIIKKPEPHYSEEARRRKTSGRVILRAILAADEKVKHIEIVTGLPHGLTEKSIEAARLIKFKPAMKDGKPVSVWVEVEYGFYVF